MNFRGAIAKNPSDTLGIEPRTFTQWNDVVAYLERITPPPKVHTPSSIRVPFETYQYLLDNEAKCQEYGKAMQMAFQDQGFLNALDVPALMDVLLQCVHVDDWEEEDADAEHVEEDHPEIRE